jgi:multidrug efflux system outer membrane protein
MPGMRVLGQRPAALGAAACLAIAAGGCVSVKHPDDDLATRHVLAPERFTELELSPQAAALSVLDGWVRAFGDPTLESLVREAWDNNPDLYVAAAQFEEAAANLRIAASYLSPTISAGAGAAHTNYDGDRADEAYYINARASWEADLWGRLRSDREAARAAVAAAGLDYEQARHSLAAAVAEAYFAVVAAHLQLEIDQQLLEAERFTAITTQQRVDAGLGLGLDMDLAESSVRLAEAAVADDQAALRAARRALEVLLGRYPSAEIAAATSRAFPALGDAAVGVGVPSELLERRPDVRAAARRVDAAFYGVQSARAARLPSLILSGDIRNLIDPSDFIATVAGDILAPLFEGGRLRAREDAARARQQQALGAFASVALRAFAEVENALSNERHLMERERQLTLASQRLMAASDAAINRYDQGLMTILDLQQIRRSDYSTRSLLLSVRFERLRQRLGLLVALGAPALLEVTNTNDAIGSSDGATDRAADGTAAASTHNPSTQNKVLRVGVRPDASPAAPISPASSASADQPSTTTSPEPRDGQ